MESAWKTAARAWWERMRNAEHERDEARAEAEATADVSDEQRQRAKRAEQERDELLQKLEELQKAAESAQKETHGEFAALAARIAEADAKHPRDLKDAESHDRESLLQYARRRLRDAPTWENALRCEQEEALAEIAHRNYERFADELLDVATVAMRWRRAVMERAK
jgi:chromosome segregation ATPase